MREGSTSNPSRDESLLNSSAHKARRIVTGIKPTGEPHLGNFVGMFRPAIELAAAHESFYFIADYHALTTMRDPVALRRHTMEVAASWIAAGLDSSRAVLYRQSDVPEVCELAWILECFSAKGLLNRAHAYKASVASNLANDRDHDAGINVGLFNYPLLMAADILLHAADGVPVGADQRQHVEIARDVATAFNLACGEVLTVPEAIVQRETELLPGVDGRKMSKSYGNTIPLFASEEELRRQVMRIRTDSRRPEERKDPELDVIFQIFRSIGTPEAVAFLAERYRAGGLGYGEAKQLLLARLEELLGPMAQRYRDLMASPADLEDRLRDGAAKARVSASSVMAQVREVVGLGPHHHWAHPYRGD